MNKRKLYLLSLLIFIGLDWCRAGLPVTISPGKLWNDSRGNNINAHGGGVMFYKGIYYWFGEHKADSTSSAMVGVTCYCSENLTEWKYRGVALPVSNEAGSDIERGCILERPKVIYNAKTGKFVMWFHLELKGKGYSAARYGVAISDNPTGPYRYLHSSRSCAKIYPEGWSGGISDSLYQTGMNMKWWTPEWIELIKQGMFLQRDLGEGQMARDQTVYVDDDGKAYHIFSSEDNLTLHIAELTDDYTEHTGRYWRMAPCGQNEAPAIFKKDDTYWMITSGCTGWEPNKARMFWAKNITGPWTQVDNPCRGKDADITFGAQSTYVIRIHDTSDFIFMADIWRPDFPSDARYVWLPIEWEDGHPIIQWKDSWNIQKNQ